LLKWEHVPKEKVVLIYHGYELEHVPSPDEAKIDELCRKYGILRGGTHKVIGMIARPFEWKGLDHSIPAFADVLAVHPEARLFIFNWKGTPHTQRYEALLATLPPGTWRTVHFEPDVVDLFHAFDVFVHVPEDQHAEAFGLVYAESLMAGVPCVFTRSGLMHDLDPARVKGVKVVPFKDRRAIAERTLEWLNEAPSTVQRAEFARQNVDVLRTMISIGQKMTALYRLYDSM
jgi:glycosyltransferase involved in cell wall biosynthesis